MGGTSPKDQSALLWNAQPTGRTPRPGERVWAMQKGTSAMHADIRDNGSAGAELQIFSAGEFIFGRRFATRELAIEEGRACRQELEAKGWRELAP